jgi:hypothetical protein
VPPARRIDTPRAGGNRGCLTLGVQGTQGFLDLRINATHDIANCFCAHQILLMNLDAERGLQVHDEFEAVKAADTEVIDKQSVIAYPLGINDESFCQYRFNSAVGVQ